MKILFLDWNSIGNEDIFEAAEALNEDGFDIEMIRYPFDNHMKGDDEGFESAFGTKLKETAPDFVMSFNYWPIVSNVCNGAGVKYVSWVYDDPSVNLFSYTLINPCNLVFLFDSYTYGFFYERGIKTVRFLPLAAPVQRYDRISITPAHRKKWGGQVSFVGGLYTEDHNYYDNIEGKLSDHSRGYLEALMEFQMKIDGVNLIEELLPEDVLDEMVSALGLEPNPDGVETREYLYGNYVVNRKITSLERKRLIAAVGERYPVNLFTRDKSFSSPGVVNRGRVDYYDEMPYVFKTTDINLNITLRSIRKGIPLRAMDIMGCGGFLLTNYQEDLLRFFEPGEDYVYYEGIQDLLNKTEYYLTHEEERKKIAENGYRKVKEAHSYCHRLREILEIVENCI